MKTMHLSRVIKGCGLMFLLLALGVPSFVLAQPYYPIPVAGPVVRITSPANHTTFYTPVDIPIFAFAGEAQFTYTNVAFYAGTNFLGNAVSLGVTNRPAGIAVPNYMIWSAPVTRLGAVYSWVWTNPPAGSYNLTVVAVGYPFGRLPPYGVMARTSAPVAITIVAGTTNKNPANVVNIVATDPVAIASTNAYWVWSGMTNTTPAWTNWPPKRWQLFTNWGPKNATFTVRRTGNSVSPVTVNYGIGGTASNGVDYAALPGTVTIPAGEAYSLIPVVPIDNNKTNFAGTVILTLKAATNAPPDYTVGFQARAAAVIYDHWRRVGPIPYLLSDRSFHLNATGPDGAWFAVQNSRDMLNWTTVATNQVFQGSIDFVDPNAPANGSHFYRALPLTNAPAD